MGDYTFGNYILTKDRLPADADEVLVYCQNDTYQILWYDDESKGWYDQYGEYFCDKMDVVGWMEIPIFKRY